LHIPDGYLSPQTCGAMYVAATPFWVAAARRVRKTVKNRHVPLLAIMAAYCFLVMMFNVPIPDGTTAHAVGAVLVAVLLGPWAAIVAVSVALATQALFFGDGGVLSFGANCFNMAIVMPLVGYGVYLVITRHMSLTTPRRAFAAGLGGYIGLNVAALCAATELGLQPTLFHRADGTPLYAPFHLWQSIPAMVLAHGVVAGPVELVLTAGVVAYLQRANLPLLRVNPDNPRGEREAALASGAPAPHAAEDGDDVKVSSWWWGVAALAVMAVLTPLGLLAPGTAFGEGPPSAVDLRTYHLSAVPSGLAHYAGFWHNALFNGYDFRHDAHPTVGYLVSAAVGMAVIAAGVFAVLALIRAVQRRHAVPSEPHPWRVST
jgi:cobalt/nickel transport system permease protein